MSDAYSNSTIIRVFVCRQIDHANLLASRLTTESHVLPIHADQRVASTLRDVSNARFHSIVEHVPLDSQGDYDASRRALAFQAELAKTLSTLKLNYCNFHDVIATDIFDPIVREILLREALQSFFASGEKEIIIVKGDDARGVAAIAQLEQSGAVDRVVWESLDGVHADDDTGPERLQADALASTWSELQPQSHELSVASSLVVNHKGDGAPPKERFPRRPVLFCVTQSSDLQMRHAVAILDALKKEGVPVHIGLFTGEQNLKLKIRNAPISASIFRSSVSLDHTAEAALTIIRHSIAGLHNRYRSLESTAAVLHLSDRSQPFKLLRRRANQLAAARRIIDDIAPVSVWVPEVRTAEGRAIAEAAWGRAPVYTAHAATISAHVRNLPIIEPKAVQLAYGSEVRDAYSARGFDKAPMVMTGAPHLDVYYSARFEEIRTRIRERLLIPSDEKILLVMTARMAPAIENEWLLHVFEWAASHKVRVLLRPHPRSLTTYDNIVGAYQGLARIDILSDVHGVEAIAVSDIVVSDASNAAIEAVCAKRPLLQMDVPGARLRYNNLIDIGAAVACRDGSRVGDALSKLLLQGELPDEVRGEFARRFNAGDDGGAAKRCALQLGWPQVTGTDRISANELMRIASQPGAFDVAEKT